MCLDVNRNAINGFLLLGCFGLCVQKEITVRWMYKGEFYNTNRHMQGVGTRGRGWLSREL